MSMGMERRWQAKMVFIIGMYWCAKSPETERMRMRGWRDGGAVSGFRALSAALVVVGLGVVVEALRVHLFMYVRARVRAPAMLVVGVREEGGVVSRRVEREVRRVDWIWRKGR
jgi:hypothetical protein